MYLLFYLLDHLITSTSTHIFFVNVSWLQELFFIFLPVFLEVVELPIMLLNLGRILLDTASDGRWPLVSILFFRTSIIFNGASHVSSFFSDQLILKEVSWNFNDYLSHVRFKRRKCLWCNVWKDIENLISEMLRQNVTHLQLLGFACVVFNRQDDWGMIRILIWEFGNSLDDFCKSDWASHCEAMLDNRLFASVLNKIISTWTSIYRHLYPFSRSSR